MSITISDGLADEFGRAGAPVEVRAPDGRILGTFTPVSVRRPVLNISEEELRRREEDTTSRTYTAAEVEAKLRELRCTR